MFRHIVGTTITRLLNAFMALAILLITTHHLGKEGLGTIGLIVLGITLIVLINNYIGGGALIFLASRHDMFKLIVPSYLWAVIVSVAGSLLLNLFDLIPSAFTLDILLLSLFQSLMTVNLNLLVGKERIGHFNSISVLQMLLTTIVLVYWIYFEQFHDVRAYIYGLYTGYVTGFILSLAMVVPLIRSTHRKEGQPVIWEMVRYGKFIQTANVLQLLNYRLSFYLIEFFSGRAALGIYNVGVQVSEGVWLIGKSVATVQYARISNTSDREYAIRITLLLFKFTCIISLLILLVLVCLPESAYSWIFGEEFSGVKKVILSLSPGILSTAVALMFSHYFSGTGQPVHNMVGSAIGLVLTLVLGLIFIPKFGIIAAGITASVAYLANMTYLMAVFIKNEKPSFSDFMIRSDDFRYLIREIRKM